MKKIKRLHLLQKKENLKQRTTISHLANIKNESEKCQKVEKELKDLADQKLSESEEVNGYSFHANRQLIQKLLEQREILINRQEFLKNEELVVAKEISQSKAKTDVLERKKTEEKIKLFNENEQKQEEKYSQVIKR